MESAFTARARTGRQILDSMVQRATQGGAFLLAEAIGRLPSNRLRLALARRLLGVRVDPGAKMHRWREIRGGPRLQIAPGAIIGLWATLDARNGITIGAT